MTSRDYCVVPAGYRNRAIDYHEFIHAYPNERAYEEEIRWYFYQLTR